MKTLPQIFYGMHMFPGCAEYRDPGKDPYRIYIGEEAIKNMNASFSGRPVFVDHRDEVNLENLEKEADGYVVESFYLPCDGKTWCKFIVTSDKAHEAIRMGWSLSNSYVIKERGIAGMNHGIDYVAEVLRGEYDHLAIVRNPRYEQSVILTPIQFQEYVSQKESELARVANSADETTGEPMLSFFKKTKVDNSADLENTVVQLPKSKVELTITQLVNEMDQYRLTMPLPKMANDDDYVEMNGKKVNVKEMKDCYNKMMAMKEEEEKENTEEADKELEMNKKANKDAADEEAEAPTRERKEGMKDDAGESGKDKADNEDEDEKAKKKALELAEHEKKEIEEKKSNEMFNTILNAHLNPIKEEQRPDLNSDRLARGKSRYGSN